MHTGPACCFLIAAALFALSLDIALLLRVDLEVSNDVPPEGRDKNGRAGRNGTVRTCCPRLVLIVVPLSLWLFFFSLEGRGGDVALLRHPDGRGDHPCRA